MTGQTVDVVVIGAGVAGLRAAGELALAGLKIALVEGRDRVGGRIWTMRPARWPSSIELGAEFIHGGNSALEDVMRRNRLSKRAVKEQHWFFEHGELREIPDVWDRVDDVMKKIGPRYPRSFGAWLKQHGGKLKPADRKLAKTFVEGFQGAPLDQMSARTLFEATKGEDQQFRIQGRYGKLVDALTRRLPRNRVTVHLRSVVQRIDWQRGSALVQAGKRQWRARAVLVTVPLGVLQAPSSAEGGIAFSPELRMKRKLWRSVTMGHAVRVVLRMRTDVWSRGVVPPKLRRRSGAAFGFLHSDEAFFPVWWSEAPHPVLVGWTGGPSAEKLAGMPPQLVFEQARNSLAKFFGCSAEALSRAIVDWRMHDWTADPLTRGAYSYSVAGMENLPQQMARPVERTLFFAGEALADALELGTVHGALSSGERAAGEIFGVLRKEDGATP